jgi:uncharacterized protein (DUF58 family)
MPRVAGGTALPGARFIDPTVLARIGNLDLLARNVVNGFINGLHRAPYFGASIDFAEHRGYVAGDDIRRVDWRLFARTDRFYVKQYEADTNTNFCVLFDISKSMGFKSRDVSKLEYGSYLAACLAYLAHRQRDRVGIITFDSEVVTHVPPSAKHFNVLLHTLDRAKAERPGQLAGPVSKLADISGRSVLVRFPILRRPGRHPRGDQAVALPRQRADRLPRARSGRDRLRLRRCVELRGPRKRRAAARCAGVVRQRVSQADRGALQRAGHEVLRASDRLHAHQYVEAARSCAVQLFVEPRAADESEITGP